MAALFRKLVPGIATTLIGIAIAWPAGRVATGLCDFEASTLCHDHAGATWIWLLFVGALLLSGFGLWRLAALRHREPAQAVLTDDQAALPDIPFEVTSRRLAAVRTPRTQPVPATEPPPELTDSDGVDVGDWLAAQSATTRDFIVAHWHWDYDLGLLQWLVEQPDCDGGVAAGVFWRALVEARPVDEARLYAIARAVAQRFERGRVPVRFAFDDHAADSLYAAATNAFAAGEIDWNPAYLPVRSGGAKLTIDELPRSARPAVLAFLRHIRGG